MKYLFFHGCSFTKNDYDSFDPDIKDTIKSWPHWTSQKLGKEFVCMAENGMPNSLIINETIDHVLENHKKISCVIVGLSSWDRIHVIDRRFKFIPFHHKSIKLVHRLYKEGRYPAVNEHVDSKKDYFKFYFDYLDEDSNYESSSWRTIMSDIIVDHLIVNALSFQTIYNDTLRQIINLVNICKSTNIPLLITQAVAPLNIYMLPANAIKTLDVEDLVDLAPFDKSQTIHEECVIQSPLFEHLEKIKDKSNNQVFLGWPFIDSLGGKSMTDYFREFLKKGIIEDIMESKVSKTDGHPSELAHKLYGENIIAPELVKLLGRF